MAASSTNAESSDTKAKWIAMGILTVVVFGWVTLDNARPKDVVLEKGQEAVLLHYINHSGWYPVRCEDGRHLNHDTLYCHPSGETRVGGLHIIERENGNPVVYPINGTAMGNMKQSTIEAVDTSRVPVREWRGARIDIRKAISELVGPADRAAR